MQVEGEVGAHDVVPQESHLLRLGDGGFQTGDGQGVLGTDVDVALVAAGGHAGDEHALDDGVGVALHDGPVHERAGVALVAVAHHIFFAGGLFPHAVPLAPGGEAAAPPASQAGVGDLLADLLVGHLKQGLLKGGVAVPGDVLVDILRVGGAAVLQHHTVLLLIEGDLVVLGVGHPVQLVQQPLHQLPLQEGLVDDLVAVGHLYVGVEDAVWLNLEQGAHLAEAVAAALFQVELPALGGGLHLAVLVEQANLDLDAPLGAGLL